MVQMSNIVLLLSIPDNENISTLTRQLRSYGEIENIALASEGMRFGMSILLLLFFSHFSSSIYPNQDSPHWSFTSLLRNRSLRLSLWHRCCHSNSSLLPRGTDNYYKELRICFSKFR